MIDICQGSIPDPYIVKNPSNSVSSPWLLKDDRTRVYPSLVVGETTLVLISAGQSNGVGANFVAAAYTPTNTAKNQTLNIFDGGVYQTKDPLLGGGGIVAGSIGGRLGDKLIDGGVCTRSVLVPTDLGGTLVAQWEPGGLYFDRLVSSTKRAIAVGLPPSAYLWGQGEGDNVGGTSQAAYAASLTNIITSLRALGSGFQAPWFIALQTMSGNATSSTIRAAQASVISGTVYQGPDIDSLTSGTNRQGDGTHLMATGADAAAAIWKTAIDAVF